MQLLDSDIAKFKKLYKEKFDIDLDDHEARHKLSLLVRQMELVYQPVTQKQLDELTEADAKAVLQEKKRKHIPNAQGKFQSST